MRAMAKLFGKSPFGSLAKHTHKVHECVRLIRPLMEACVREDYEEVHRLQDVVSRLEYEADQLKHEIRGSLPRQYFLPVDRMDLDRYLHKQDDVADAAQDFAVVLLIRKTRIHPDLVQGFFEFVDQVLRVGDTLMAAAEDMESLVEASFRGAEARLMLSRVGGLSEEEWKADRVQRRLSQHIYALEGELDPVTISFYEKYLRTLSKVADAAENTGDIIRQMIVKR
jgi:predicted phosphate transport protein (TIGR00153 family)